MGDRTLSNTMTMESPAITKEQRNSWLAWVVCLSASMFFFYEFIQMNMFSAITNDITREFGLDGAKLGMLSATYFYADALFLIPAGMLLDRYATRTVILISMTLCVFATLLFAMASNVWFAAGCRFLTGIGNAFAFLACIRLASRWFPPRRMGLVVGVVVTIAMLGGAVAQTPLTVLVEDMGWRHAMMVNAFIGAILVLMIYFTVHDYPAEMQQNHEQELQEVHELGIWRSLTMTISNWQNWLAGLFTSFLNLSIFILGAVWGALYLQQAEHLTPAQSTNVTMMVFIGTIIGAPIVGYVSDKLARRRMPMLVGGFLSLITVCAIIYIPHLSYASYIALFLLLGLFTSTQVLGYPVISESNHGAVTSTAMALGSILIMGGGAVFQPLFGWMLDYHWMHIYHHHEPFYSLQNFNFALIILPITFALAIMATLCIRETYARNIASPEAE